MSSTDRDALLALFHSTGGAGWERKDNWNTDAELSKWHGVNVNAEGRVVKLSLPSNNLRGISSISVYSVGTLSDRREVGLSPYTVLAGATETR